MASTVNLPGIGPTGKGKVYGIAIGGLAVAGFLIYKKNATNKKQQAATAAAQAQAAAAYGYSDQQASGYEASGYYGYGASGGFNATGYYGYGLTAPPGGSAGPVANTTNAQWDQAAITQLAGNGYDRQSVSAALGAYLNGAGVTSDQQSIVQQAIGIEGYPPVAGANGFPPSINVQGTPGGGTGGGQSGGGGTTPGRGGGGGGGAPTVSALPQLNGLTLAQAESLISQSGWQLGTVTYKYQQIDPASYLQHPVYSYTPNPSTGTVNIGLN